LTQECTLEKGFDGDKQIYLVILIVVHIIQMGFNVKELGRKKRESINSSAGSFIKTFLWMAVFFLVLDGVIAGVCLPVLMGTPECPSVIRQWAFVDIILMISCVPNIWYSWKVTTSNEERNILFLIKQIHKGTDAEDLKPIDDAERVIEIEKDMARMKEELN